MKLRSLVLRTDMMFNRFSGEIIDRGDYLVIRTPSRPDYFWGNYLIMNHPPQAGDLEKWIELFEKEIGPRNERSFIAITWDSIDGEQGKIKPFSDFGFSVHKSIILTAQSIHQPSKFRSELTVHPLSSDEDWDQFIDIHFDPDWTYGEADTQRQFLKDKRDHLRVMVDADLGLRFGVELEGKIVGELGIYWDDKIGRFNEVATHRDYRRQGVCSTLVYTVAKFVLETKGIDTLVMEADDGYHAAKIYESVGFIPSEKNVSLEWLAKS